MSQKTKDELLILERYRHAVQCHKECFIHFPEVFEVLENTQNQAELFNPDFENTCFYNAYDLMEKILKERIKKDRIDNK